MATRLTMVVAIACAAIAAGCGGQGDSGDGEQSGAKIEESSISKAEFVRQANTICQRGKERMVGAFLAHRRRSGASSLREAEVGTAEAILQPSIDEQIEEIRELGAPAGDAERLEAFFASMQRAVAEVARRDLRTRESLPVLQPAGDLALAYGIDQCAYGY